MAATGAESEIDKQKVAELLAAVPLPAEVESTDTQFGVDHTGDPAIFITFHVKKQAKIERRDLERLSAFASEVTSTLWEAGVGGFPYTRLEQED